MHAGVLMTSGTGARYPLCHLPYRRPVKIRMALPTKSLCTQERGVLKALKFEASLQSPKKHHWLLVGLGNPGRRFIGTRHNVGFQMIDAIAKAEGINMGIVNFKSIIGKGSIEGHSVLLVKPQTFMNASGESVRAISAYYKIPSTQVLVVLDDMDLPFAKMRMVPKGGHGGHNGMRDIIHHMKGDNEIHRMRIGIGRPPHNTDAFNYVLSRFTSSEEKEMDFVSRIAVQAARVLLKEGFARSASFVNSLKAWQKLG